MLWFVFVQYSTVQYSTVQYSTGQDRTGQDRTGQYKTGQYGTVQDSTSDALHIYVSHHHWKNPQRAIMMSQKKLELHT
jgi:hypothetical protein